LYKSTQGYYPYISIKKPIGGCVDGATFVYLLNNFLSKYMFYALSWVLYIDK